jgi:transcriptional regulator with PAS, ATPase and Fis domain
MSHEKLTQLIQKASRKYLKQAGPYGKLLKDFTQEFEKIIIVETLDYYSNNLSLSAKSLGISRNSLYKKIKSYNLILR